MPLTTIENVYTLSDLVQNENDPSVGYNREVIPVDFVAETDVIIGTLAAIDNTDETAYRAFALTDLADADTTYAVLIGDQWKAQSNWTIGTAATKAVAFVRGYEGLILKEWMIKKALEVSYNIVPDATQWAQIVAKLKAQGIIVERTVPSSGD